MPIPFRVAIVALLLISAGAQSVLGAETARLGIPEITSAGGGARAGAISPAGNVIRTLDSVGDVGQHTSIAIGADGLPVIAYYDATNGDLKVAHCDDPTCGSVTVRTTDTAGDVGADTSLAIGSDGLPIISYYDATNGDLKIAHCGDATCASAILRTLDSAGDVGAGSSIAIGADGLPVISYADKSNYDLKIGHCGDNTCSTVTIRSLEGLGDIAWYTSIDIGSDGLPIIGFYDAGTSPPTPSSALKVAHCEDVFCQSASIAVIPVIVYRQSASAIAVTVGHDGLPVVAYHLQYYPAWTFHTIGHLGLAHCDDLMCSSESHRSLDGGLYPYDVGYYAAITLGADGFPIVSYYAKATASPATDSDLRVVHCEDVACTIAGIQLVDRAGDVGQFTSIAVGADKLPIISYYDATNGDLKIVHCGSATCEVPTVYLPLAGG